MSEQMVVEPSAPASAPVSEPVIDTAPASAESPDVTPEPTEPAADAAVDAVDGAQETGGDVTLSKDQVEALLDHIKLLESYQQSGGQQAPIAPPENADALAQKADQVEQDAAQGRIVPWEPLTPEKAESLGMYAEAAEVLNERDRVFAQNVVAAVEGRVQSVLQQAAQLVNEANDRAEVASLTIALTQANPDYNQCLPQVRIAIAQARAANPSATPDAIFAAAKKAVDKHVVGINALKNLRGVQMPGTQAMPGAPGTARQPQAPAKPVSFAERVLQLANGR